MGEWLENLPVVWMALVVFALTYLAALLIYVVVGRIGRGERARTFKGISPGLLPPLGIIFGLFVTFVASQVWSDIDRAKDAVNREAIALSSVVFLAASFPGEPQAQIVDLTRRDIQETVTNEWPAMVQGSGALRVTPTLLAEELELVVGLSPKNAGQTTAQREMVAALERAMEARRQRIIASRSVVNWVKWSALLLQGALTLVAIAMVHNDNRPAAAGAMGLFATGIGIGILVIATHERPFQGEISIKPTLLQQVMQEEADSQPAIDRALAPH